MHAAIKIISFLVFGAAVSTGSGQVLLAGVLLVAPLYVIEKTHLHGVMVMLGRLKWLFVSIMVVYLFFTPGQLLLPGVLWGPTLEGLLQGFLRVMALVLLVAAVNVLITSTDQEEFLSAILWCLRPLSVFGISHERLAIRISLTLDTVSQARKAFKDESPRGQSQTGDTRLGMITGTASRLFESAITTADSVPLKEIVLPEETRPPVHQWLIPLALLVLFVLLQKIAISEWV